MPEVSQKRSPKEVEDLKNQWRADPHWDIEDTEGFDAHRDELSAYRARCEAEWSRRNDERLDKKAKELGCPGNRSLAAYVLDLENDLARLSRRVEILEDL